MHLKLLGRGHYLCPSSSCESERIFCSADVVIVGVQWILISKVLLLYSYAQLPDDKVHQTTPSWISRNALRERATSFPVLLLHISILLAAPQRPRASHNHFCKLFHCQAPPFFATTARCAFLYDYLPGLEWAAEVNKHCS